MIKEIILCARCEKEIEKKAHNQRYCTPCNGERNRENGRAKTLKTSKSWRRKQYGAFRS